MKSTDKPSKKTPTPENVEKTEEDPAVQRGERIESGKEIARGGKTGGKVPGASPDKK